jgi:hypothetical protein
MSLDKTWCLWDIHSQKLKMKIASEFKPNTCISLPSNKVILADVTADLKIYNIRQ